MEKKQRVLTHEDLDKIKLPLSKDDYQILKNSVWDGRYKKDLLDAYLEKVDWEALQSPTNAAYSDLM